MWINGGLLCALVYGRLDRFLLPDTMLAVHNENSKNVRTMCTKEVYVRYQSFVIHISIAYITLLPLPVLNHPFHLWNVTT